MAISGGGVLRLEEIPRIAKALGANRALHKPVELDELLRTVHELLPEAGTAAGTAAGP